MCVCIWLNLSNFLTNNPFFAQECMILFQTTYKTELVTMKSKLTFPIFYFLFFVWNIAVFIINDLSVHVRFFSFY